MKFEEINLNKEYMYVAFYLLLDNIYWHNLKLL